VGEQNERERVAAAMWDASEAEGGGVPVAWEDALGVDRAEYLRMADAALSAFSAPAVQPVAYMVETLYARQPSRIHKPFFFLASDPDAEEVAAAYEAGGSGEITYRVTPLGPLASPQAGATPREDEALRDVWMARADEHEAARIHLGNELSAARQRVDVLEAEARRARERIAALEGEVTRQRNRANAAEQTVAELRQVAPLAAPVGAREWEEAAVDMEGRAAEAESTARWCERWQPESAAHYRGIATHHRLAAAALRGALPDTRLDCARALLDRWAANAHAETGHAGSESDTVAGVLLQCCDELSAALSGTPEQPASGTMHALPGCAACRLCLAGVRQEGSVLPVAASRMIVCPDCRNKRCPKATDHRHVCTGSNEPGQSGSVFAAVPDPYSLDSTVPPFAGEAGTLDTWACSCGWQGRTRELTRDGPGLNSRLACPQCWGRVDLVTTAPSAAPVCEWCGGQGCANCDYAAPPAQGGEHG
jgi:hypothetical protein